MNVTLSIKGLKFFRSRRPTDFAARLTTTAMDIIATAITYERQRQITTMTQNIGSLTFTCRLTRAATDSAVQALASSYRADGFNAVRVTLTSQATRASGLVALTVTVDEGPRQVLRDIAIEGARRTNPSLVSRELHLDVGQPVDLSAWAQARKRLYDTGVFRQVDIQAVPIDELPAGSPPPAEQPVRARVTLDEWPPLRVRYGFELDEERKPASETVLRPGVAADVTYRNVFGRAASTGLALR